MIRGERVVKRGPVRLPRMRGDDPSSKDTLPSETMFAPHVWGCSGFKTFFL